MEKDSAIAMDKYASHLMFLSEAFFEWVNINEAQVIAKIEILNKNSVEKLLKMPSIHPSKSMMLASARNKVLSAKK
jgi:hypothetical protein